MQSKLKRNRQAYVVGQLGWLALQIPVIIPFWQRNGLSFSQILLLQGIFGLLLVILEFPSGVLADYLQRKHLIAGGHLFVALGTLIYSVSNSFNEFVLAESCYAIGFAARSGADSASIWDAYLEVDVTLLDLENNITDDIRGSSNHSQTGVDTNYNELKAKQLIASGRTIMMGSAVVFMVIGGIIGAKNLYLPFYLSAIGSLLVSTLYFRAPEPKRRRLESASATWKGAINFLKDPKIIEVFMLYLMLMVGLRIVFWAYIPKLQYYNVNPIYFGIVLAAANLVATLSSIYIRKNSEPNTKVMAFVIFLGWLGLLFFVVDSQLLMILIGIAFHQISRGVIGSVAIIEVNGKVKSEVRASVISLLNSLATMMYLSISIGVDYIGMSFRSIMILNTFLSFIILGIWLFSRLKITKNTDFDLNPIVQQIQSPEKFTVNNTNNSDLITEAIPELLSNHMAD